MGGQCVELAQQNVQVVGPDVVFGFLAVDDHVGGPAVAPVVEQHAVTRLRNPLGQGPHRVARAPPAGRQRHPRSPAADDFVVDRCAAYCNVWHDASPCVWRCDDGALHQLRSQNSSSMGSDPGCVESAHLCLQPFVDQACASKVVHLGWNAVAVAADAARFEPDVLVRDAGLREVLRRAVIGTARGTTLRR